MIIISTDNRLVCVRVLVFVGILVVRMAEEGGGGNEDLYGVLGLKKDCSELELRHAYKKLALQWHPDRCSALGDSERVVEEAKNKFQAIQQAYSVLSDANKRFLYDVGAYESDEDDDYNVGMSDFLNEMVSLMSQTKPNQGSGGEESMEELQQLLKQMFEADHINSSSSSSYLSFKATRNSFYDFDINNVVGSSKESFHFDHHASNNFCFQTNGAASRYEEGKRRKRGGGSSSRSQGHKKQKD